MSYKRTFWIFNLPIVDYGKLPIIHSDWGDVDYKYKTSNKSQFDYVLKQIQNDSYEENKSNFDKLKSYMLSYDKKDR